MSDQWGFDPDAHEFEQGNNTNKGLRSWAESVKNENKALKDELSAIRADLRKQQAVNTFEDLGLPRAAASLYTGELTPDAVNAWATQMRTVFGGANPTPADQTPAAPALTAEQQQNLQNITQAGANSTPTSSIDDMLRAQNQATSIQDLINNAALWNR